MPECKIPKIIFQEWFVFPGAKGKYKTGKVPDHWKSSPESIKKFMPDWEYVLVSNEMADTLIKENFPEYYDTYQNLEYPIMQVDFFRYVFLYLYGGVYMDLDIELKKSLEDLFYEDADLYLVKSGNVGSVYTNSFLASKPRNKLWLECLKEIQKPYKYWMIGKHLKTMGKTGPLMLTSVINKNRYNYDIHNVPGHLLMPCSACDKKPCTKPGAYTIALEGSSWCGWDTYIFTGCICYWKYILLIILLILIILFVINAMF